MTEHGHFVDEARVVAVHVEPRFRNEYGAERLVAVFHRLAGCVKSSVDTDQLESCVTAGMVTETELERSGVLTRSHHYRALIVSRWGSDRLAWPSDDSQCGRPAQSVERRSDRRPSWQLTESDVISLAINVVQNGLDGRELRPDLAHLLGGSATEPRGRVQSGDGPASDALRMMPEELCREILRAFITHRIRRSWPVDRCSMMYIAVYKGDGYGPDGS